MRLCFLKFCCGFNFKFNLGLVLYKKKKIGLALGGGGARGYAHLGVLYALKEAGIEVDVYSGTSMGAIISVAYLQKREIKHSEISLRKFVNGYAKRFDAISFAETDGYEKKSLLTSIKDTLLNGAKFTKLALKTNSNDGKILQEITNDFIYPCDLEELPKKVFICATDIKTGQGVLMSKGDARESIRAAISIAGCFPGVPLRDRVLIDSSSMFSVPIHAFQFEPVDFILAVDVGVNVVTDYKPTSALDLLLRQYDLMCNHGRSEVKYCSDYVICPDVDDIYWANFKKLELALKRGYDACKKAIPEIKKLLNSKKKPVPISERPWHNVGYKIDPVVLDSFPSIER